LAHDIAKRLTLLELVSRRFTEFGIPLEIDRTVVPTDDTTLFTCSGMQRHKGRFEQPDGSGHGSVQSCVRTNDLELVGDGTHLTSFEMVGNFSFGGDDYERSVELWDCLLRDLEIEVTHVTCHPTRGDHRELWTRRGYPVVPLESCRWSDGEIGGFCCEVFVGDLELGNLVNPLGHSTDVGFGLERLLMTWEGKQRVEQTSLFRQDLHPVVSDHVRTLELLRENGVQPGGKGRGYVCRRLVRRILPLIGDPSELPSLTDWIVGEQEHQRQRLKTGRRLWRKFKDRSPEFWRETFGLTPEDLDLLGDE
jgi:alanyl-tRNA synthetase